MIKYVKRSQIFRNIMQLATIVKQGQVSAALISCGAWQVAAVVTQIGVTFLTNRKGKVCMIDFGCLSWTQVPAYPLIFSPKFVLSDAAMVLAACIPSCAKNPSSTMNSKALVLSQPQFSAQHRVGVMRSFTADEQDVLSSAVNDLTLACHKHGRARA